MGERATACSDLGKDANPDRRLTVLVDSGGTFGKLLETRTIQEAICILSSHYPNRLHKVFLLNTPQTRAFNSFWTSLMTKVSQLTQARIINCFDGRDLIDKVFDVRTLERWAGGENDVPFNSEIFLSRKVHQRVFGVEFDEQSKILNCK